MLEILVVGNFDCIDHTVSGIGRVLHLLVDQYGVKFLLELTGSRLLYAFRRVGMQSAGHDDSTAAVHIRIDFAVHIHIDFDIMDLDYAPEENEEVMHRSIFQHLNLVDGLKYLSSFTVGRATIDAIAVYASPEEANRAVCCRNGGDADGFVVGVGPLQVSYCGGGEGGVSEVSRSTKGERAPKRSRRYGRARSQSRYEEDEDDDAEDEKGEEQDDRKEDATALDGLFKWNGKGHYVRGYATAAGWRPVPCGCSVCLRKRTLRVAHRSLSPAIAHEKKRAERSFDFTI